MSKDYSLERGSPSVPQCGRSRLAISFGNGWLKLQGGTKPHLYPAKSGKPGAYAAIPPGSYWIRPDEMWHCNALRKILFWAEGLSCDDSGWGMYRITIHPYPGTDTGGRGGFFLHGGNHEGSAGCINLGLKVSDFISDLESEINGRADCFIPLTVK